MNDVPRHEHFVVSIIYNIRSIRVSLVPECLQTRRPAAGPSTEVRFIHRYTILSCIIFSIFAPILYIRDVSSLKKKC